MLLGKAERDPQRSRLAGHIDRNVRVVHEAAQVPLPGFDSAEAASARARMRATIELLSAATVPPWTDQMAVILQDGAFKPATRLVPPDEANALWAEFDFQMERLYPVWVQTQPAQEC